MDGNNDVARPRVRLRRATWDRETLERGLRTDADCAYLLRTSQSTISRVKNGEVEPGQKFISAALWRFSGLKFEDLFEIVYGRAAP